MDGTRRRYGGIGYLNGFHVRGRLKTGYNYHFDDADAIILMYEPVSRTVLFTFDYSWQANRRRIRRLFQTACPTVRPYGGTP